MGVLHYSTNTGRDRLALKISLSTTLIMTIKDQLSDALVRFRGEIQDIIPEAAIDMDITISGMPLAKMLTEIPREDILAPDKPRERWHHSYRENYTDVRLISREARDA